jgi:hypothetical protein
MGHRVCTNGAPRRLLPIQELIRVADGLRPLALGIAARHTLRMPTTTLVPVCHPKVPDRASWAGGDRARPLVDRSELKEPGR